MERGIPKGVHRIHRKGAPLIRNGTPGQNNTLQRVCDDCPAYQLRHIASTHRTNIRDGTAEYLLRMARLHLENNERLKMQDGQICLTRQGIFVSDSIIYHLLPDVYRLSFLFFSCTTGGSSLQLQRIAQPFVGSHHKVRDLKIAITPFDAVLKLYSNAISGMRFQRHVAEIDQRSIVSRLLEMQHEVGCIGHRKSDAFLHALHFFNRHALFKERPKQLFASYQQFTIIGSGTTVIQRLADSL